MNANRYLAVLFVIALATAQGAAVHAAGSITTGSLGSLDVGYMGLGAGLATAISVTQPVRPVREARRLASAERPAKAPRAVVATRMLVMQAMDPGGTASWAP